jgi:hypothetical protein
VHTISIKEMEQGELYSVEQDRSIAYWAKCNSALDVIESTDMLRIVYQPMWSILLDLSAKIILFLDVEKIDIMHIDIICVMSHGEHHPENEYMLLILLRDGRKVSFPFNLSIYHTAGMEAITRLIEFK